GALGWWRVRPHQVGAERPDAAGPRQEIAAQPRSSRQVTFDERLVDYDHWAGVCRVERVERSSLRHLRAERLEVPFADAVELRLRRILRSSWGRLSFDQKRAAPTNLERQEVAGAHRDHAGLLADLRPDPRVRGRADPPASQRVRIK